MLGLYQTITKNNLQANDLTFRVMFKCMSHPSKDVTNCVRRNMISTVMNNVFEYLRTTELSHETIYEVLKCLNDNRLHSLADKVFDSMKTSKNLEDPNIVSERARNLRLQDNTTDATMVLQQVPESVRNSNI
eukprot:UN29020